MRYDSVRLKWVSCGNEPISRLSKHFHCGANLEPAQTWQTPEIKLFLYGKKIIRKPFYPIAVRIHLSLGRPKTQSIYFVRCTWTKTKTVLNLFLICACYLNAAWKKNQPPTVNDKRREREEGEKAAAEWVSDQNTNSVWVLQHQAARSFCVCLFCSLCVCEKSIDLPTEDKLGFG